MAIERTLRMFFDTDMNKEATISIKHPKDVLTEAGVKEVMDIYIARQPFIFDLTAKVGAEVVEREVNEIF